MFAFIDIFGELCNTIWLVIIIFILALIAGFPLLPKWTRAILFVIILALLIIILLMIFL